MTFQALKPMLRTWDLLGTITFYRDVLGFSRETYVDDWGRAQLVRDGIGLMLSGPNEYERDRAPQFNGSLFFVCNDDEKS